MFPTFCLNETSLVFVPSTPDAPAAVVQVTMSTQKKPHNSVEVLACYYLFQHEVSELASRILIAHLQQPLPSTTLFVGSEYTLRAEHKSWKLGSKWGFRWGDETVDSALDKWIFVFNPNPKVVQ